MSKAPSDLEIARSARPLDIESIAEKLEIPPEDRYPYGRDKAKLSLSVLDRVKNRPKGKLILVTGMTPTPPGEGKTTATISIGDALNRMGKKALICLREPSLGPCFGMKGGAAGGGYAQVIPMEDINLHFTGDFHAIGLANNLLAAAVDNLLHHRSGPPLDPRKVSWNRVIDMNDRSLRKVIVGLGGSGNSFPRENGFTITAASEIMAVLCLTESLDELKTRLGNIIVGDSFDRTPVRAKEYRVQGAMAALLKDAIKPNLVQTLENNPALIHGGPFANIAHGCNSVIATKMALGLSDFVVTEAGFGADLGAEKFINIKCRKSGLYPDAAVIVATIRALKHHGKSKDLAKEEPEAVTKGFENVKRHLENLGRFGVPTLVSLNHFSSDTASEIKAFEDCMKSTKIPYAINQAWAKGSEGATELCEKLLEVLKTEKPKPSFSYPNELSLWKKVQKIAQEIYGADDIEGDMKLRNRFRALDKDYGHFPVCMAKTQYSFSTDPKLLARPKGFNVPLKGVRLSAGAEFVLVLTGDILTMPGLPKKPAAESIDIRSDSTLEGLF